MQRRGFLGAILAAGMAPAVIGSGVLMPVKKIVVPKVLTMAQFQDITMSLQEYMDRGYQEYQKAMMDSLTTGTGVVKVEFGRYSPITDFLPLISVERRIIT